MFIIDAHEDIAWNALNFGRDYTGSALAIRAKEAHTPVPHQNGLAMLGRAEWLLGRVGIVFATIFVSPWDKRIGSWDTQSYRDAAEAHRFAQAQLDYYHRLEEEQPVFKIVRGASDLEAVRQSWESTELADKMIGLVLLMEGADPIGEPAEAEYWYERGVRIIGPAWSGTRYSGGTGKPGPLTDIGHELLEVMSDLNIILDLSHISEEAFYQALDHFDGTTIASHSNPRQIAEPHSPDRALSDEQIRALGERSGVIGVVPYNRFLSSLWTAADGKRAVRVEQVVDAIDHIFQVTGRSNHVGIGSDFDGGFGAEATPAEIDTVADLGTIRATLFERGFEDSDVEGVMCGNWLRILRQTLANNG